jgi:nucleoside-diphosphate-sugar epimerase
MNVVVTGAAGFIGTALAGRGLEPGFAADPSPAAIVRGHLDFP